MARSLSSTLAMLQMHVVPSADEAVTPDSATDQASGATAFVADLFAGVLNAPTPVKASG